MEIDELIEKVDKEMRGENPWLRLISVSRINNSLLYINEEEFKMTGEYRILHELARYNILQEGSNQYLIKFCTNSNTREALNNLREYFFKIKNMNQ